MKLRLQSLYENEITTHHIGIHRYNIQYITSLCYAVKLSVSFTKRPLHRHVALCVAHGLSVRLSCLRL